ncbi:MAG: 50S ribosomal protein L6 [Roseiarcus sp.]
MSRVGKKPVLVPAGVSARLDGRTVAVKGAKGELKFTASDDVAIKVEGNLIRIDPRADSKRAQAMWGTARSMVQNLIVGVTKGFEKRLEINGVGYKAAVAGKNLQLSLGFSHDVIYPIPAGVTIVTPKPTEITIAGIDKRQVGQIAAEIRAFRPPEPYKGKGVKYVDEFIFRKEGKKK